MTDHELNEAVARKLGWELERHPNAITPYWIRGQETVDLEDLPDYCHSIEAAWEVVEHLHKLEYHVELIAWPMETRKAYSCDITELGVDKHNFCETDTAPMAICLAYLKLHE